MQSDHTTIFEIGEQADDLMTEMGAAGFHGMSNAQADIVVRMGRLLDRAARAISGPENTKTGQLINRAANHALAMRMHGSTLRGVTGAEMLEDLCDAVLAKHLNNPPVPLTQVVEVPEDMSVEDAMRLMRCESFAALARELSVSMTSIKVWRRAGRITTPWVNKIRRMYRSRMEMAA